MRPRVGLGEAALVTAVSVLIFYLAFSQTKKEVDFTFTVEIVADPGDEETKLVGERQMDVRATVAGSAVARGDAAVLFARERSPIKIFLRQLDVTPGTELIEVTDLQRPIQEYLSAEAAGLIVRSVSHDPISLRVDKFATLERPVVLRLPPGVPVESIVVEPGAATIVAGQSQLVEAGNIVPEAVINETTLRNLEPGRRQLEVPLRPLPDLPGGDYSDVTFAPARVLVSFTVPPRERELRIPSDGTTLLAIPVYIAISPLDLDRFEIEVPERDLLLVEVALQGPADRIALIESGAERVFAFIAIASDELERALIDRPDGAEIVKSTDRKSWSLPTGVRVVELGSTQAQFHARRASEPAPAGVRVNVRRRPVTPPNAAGE